MLQENQIQFGSNLPFQFKKKTVLYIGGDYFIDAIIDDNEKIIKRRLRERRYHFKNLPSIINSIPFEVWAYYFPGSDLTVWPFDAILGRIKELLNIPAQQCGLLIINDLKDGRAIFYPIDLQDEDGPVGQISSVIESLPYFPPDDGEVKPKKKQKRDKREFTPPTENILEDEVPRTFCTCIDEIILEPQDTTEIEIARIEKDCDAYVSVNKRKLLSLGLSPEILAELLGEQMKPSRLKIDRAGRFILEDYHRELELDSQSKSLYFLFLRHREGIRLKTLMDYEGELLDLYQSFSGWDNLDAMKSAIHHLVEPGNNQVNVLIARIKSAFIKAFNPVLAKQYYIDGPRGEAKTIALDRDLVKSDTIRPLF